MAKVARKQQPPKPGRAVVALNLDRKRTLKFDFNALCAYEEATGKNILADGFRLTNPSASDVRALLWAALLHEDPDLTLHDVGRIISECFARPGFMTEVEGKLGEAVAASFPEPSEEGARDESPLDG